MAAHAWRGLAAELEGLGDRVKEAAPAIQSWHMNSDGSWRLDTIPGVGPITPSAIAAAVADRL